jgi:asparagine synthase (glutamine-hydrolysing)
MSGVCGVVNFDGTPVEAETLEKMAQAAAHRGPDGIRYWRNGSAALANLALNLTPESLREKQPLVSRQDDLVLTADARLDNRSELIRTLIARDHLQDKAPTDAELILASYRCWGEGCAAHFVGDFAFALWDAGRRRLFAARDAMAMRAFYYRVERSRVLFGTEVKQILAAPGVPARIFEPAVGVYLVGPIVPLEWSFYEGISQLAPAHAMVVDESGCRVWRYWDIDPDYRVRYRTEDEYVEHFFEIFEEAVRCRLRSVKPVGILLSGGMDSGSAASTAGRLLQRDGEGSPPSFRAYSWAFEELAECDERHISSGIASHYGFPVTDVPADAYWPLKGYPAHGPDRDEPFIGPYQALIERSLAAARSEGVGLMLSGDRGDLLVGDVIVDHLGLLLAGKLHALWGELRAHGRWRNDNLSGVMMRQLLKPLLFDLWPQGAQWALDKRQKLRGRETSPQYPPWVRPEFAERVGLAEILKESEPQPTMSDYARRMRYGLLFTFMHMRGMVWSERTNSRFGQGFADPWSDRRLASFVLGVPQWVIQRSGENKRIARRAMRAVMPEQIRRGAQKIEPVSLFDRGFKERARGTVAELLTDSRAAALGYLDAGVFCNLYESFLRNEPQRHDFWWPLTLEMWLRQYWD